MIYGFGVREVYKNRNMFKVRGKNIGKYRDIRIEEWIKRDRGILIW